MKTIRSEKTDSPRTIRPARRRLIKAIAATGVAYVAAPMIGKGRYALFADTPQEYSTRAIDLVSESLVIDMLAPIDLRKTMSFFMKSDPFRDKDVVDPQRLAMMKASGINVFHASQGIGPSHVDVLQYLNDHNGLIANNSDNFMRIDSVEDLERVKSSGKMGILLGLQNSEHFHVGQPEHIEMFYRAGQRVSQLTYNRATYVGTGSTDRVDGGLTDWGAAVVEKMNDVGMAIDVSHCGDRTSMDAVELSKKPILITHSNSRVLSGGHPRCKPDDLIKAVAKKGGVMGISFIRIFVRGEEPTTIEHLLDHFDYVAKLVGIEHLGIGSDADVAGYDALPQEMLDGLYRVTGEEYRWRDRVDIEGLDHPKKIFDLTEGLIRRGYTNEDIVGVLGENFKRVLAQIWI